MSDLEGINQNGGVPDEQYVAPAPLMVHEACLNDTAPSDLDSFNELDNTTDSVLDDSHLIGDETIEYQQDVTGTTPEENSSQSRELKSLLALSKEANLDTNLVRKRKVLPSRKRSKGELRLKSSKVQYPVTAESELELDRSEVMDDDGSASTSSGKSTKRKKSVDEVSLDEGTRRSRKSFTSGVVMFKLNKDMFCWRCHKDGVNIACETCPRSYHQKCLKQTITDLDHWPCPECVSILKAESTNSRSPAMKGMTLEHLCSLLKFAVRRMIKCPGSEPFVHEVDDSDFPEYKKYIIQPMDLTQLQHNIKDNLYGSTQAFEADAKWILHNSIVFNSYLELSLKSGSGFLKYQSKLTTAAKSIMKICKQEMSEIENCPNCYLNANTKRKTWFVEVCPKPHLLVWAKLRGFPFWPAKTMKCKDGMVDVRFFGAHDRAWVPEKECFLYTPKDPNLFRVKRADIEQCIEELKIHVENLKKTYGEFTYPPFKTQIDPDHENKQLHMFLPGYLSGVKTKKSASLDGKEEEQQYQDRNRAKLPEDEHMEGYGTDDESVTELDTEFRQNMLKQPIKPMEVDDDDTQVPANVEADTNSGEEIVLTKPATSEEERRNSEPKINRLDISEDVEIALGNPKERVPETVSSSNSECSSDFSVELKKKPVQVDVDNVEFTISPASKLKITEKLIKRLSDDDCADVDRVKKNLNDAEQAEDKETVNWTVKDVSAKADSTKIVIKAVRVADKPGEDSEVGTKENTAEVQKAVESEDACSPLPTDHLEPSTSSKPSIKIILHTVNAPEDAKTAESGAKESVQSLLKEQETVEEAPTTDLVPVTTPEDCKKGQKRKLAEEGQETQTKMLKIVPIETIRNQEKEDSLLRTSLQTKKIAKEPSSSQSSPVRSSVPAEEIKSEPDAETVAVPVQDLEAKKKYLSALNILEKGAADVQKSSKTNEIRTRSKTEEKREKNRTGNEAQSDRQLSKSNESTASSVRSNVTKKKIIPFPFACSPIESLPKSAPDTVPMKPRCKQTARKSFPCPNYPKSTPPTLPVSKPQAISTAAIESTRLTPKTIASSPITTAVTPVITSVAPVITSAPKAATLPQIQQLDAMRTTNGYLILQPQQQPDNLVFLPPNHTISYTTPLANIASQVVSMTPCLLSTSSVGQQGQRQLAPPQIWYPGQTSQTTDKDLINVASSQNYIPQGETLAGAIVLNTGKKLVNGVSEGKSATASPTPEPAVSSGGALPSVNSESEPIVIADGDSDDVILPNGIATEVSRTLNDLFRRQPPRLRPRPPGALSQQFSEGVPDAAGPVTAKINSIAHRLGDYFRGMLIETLEDLSKSGVSEASKALLKLEIETLKHRHSVEIAEIENNANTVMQDCLRSFAEEKERIVEETRAACEAERIRRVDEAKSKQWCANCKKEAQFYCCWNTSYCDYPCQQKHWPSHMSKCTQNQANQVGGGAMRPGGQQLILRPANPPNKGALGRVFTKPVQKVYMNRNLTQPKAMRVQTTAGNLLTMMETTPGNYQLVTTSAIMKPGPSLAAIQPGLLSVSNSANHQTHKNLVPKLSPIKLVGHNVPVNAVPEEESD